MKKRAEMMSMPYLFILLIIILAVVMLMGYKAIKSFIGKSCQTAVFDLKSDLSKEIDAMSIKRGSVEEKKFMALCDRDKLYFIDCIIPK